jgi:hypothetical protein
MKHLVGRISLALLGAMLFSASAAEALSFTFDTPAGSTIGGEPVSAEAVFATLANGTITIALTNNQTNPTSVGQNLSDLGFSLSNPSATSGTLTSSSGMERTVAANGTFTNGPTVATGWALSGLQLTGLDGAAETPAHTIIGPPAAGGTYAAANASIAGNGPHNPFLAGTVNFLLTIPGVTASTIVTGATFSFGTEAGANVPGVPTTPLPPPVAEPGTLFLLGSALGALGFYGWRKTR